jgi:phage terminase small subunit
MRESEPAGKKPKAPKSELTPKQRLFAAEYLKDGVGKAAAIRAGYAERYADREASRLLADPRIAELVNVKIDAQVKRVENDADRILRELMRLGYSDIRRLFKDDGTVKHPKDWPAQLARAIASIEVEELFEGSGDSRTWIGYTKKVKFWPKDRALELLGKNRKLFTDKVEHSVDESYAAILEKSWDEEKKK